MINLSSPEFQQDMQRLNALRTQVVLWLVVLALAVVLIPLMLISGWVRNDVARLENELLAVQSALNTATTPSGEVARIRDEIARIDQLVSTMQTVTVSSGLNWPMITGAVVEYDPAVIELTSLTQTGKKVQITGRATNNDAVVRYQQALLKAGAFDDVVVISLVAAPPSTTASGQKATKTEEDDAAATKPADQPFGAVEFVIDLFVNPNANQSVNQSVNQNAGSDKP